MLVLIFFVILHPLLKIYEYITKMGVPPDFQSKQVSINEFFDLFSCLRSTYVPKTLEIFNSQFLKQASCFRLVLKYFQFFTRLI